MALSIGEIEATLRLRDEMSAQINSAVGNLKRVGKTLEDVGHAATAAGTGLAIGLTAPLVAASGASLKFSTQFESSITKLSTLSDVASETVSAMRDEILALAPAVGVGPGELARALLVVTSTGLRGAEAMQVLERSAKASAIGLGATADVSRAVTAAVNAWGVSNLSAARATDILVQSVVEGGAEATEMATTIGRVVGIAAEMGVSFEETGAFVATFTRLGIGADEAVTALRGTLTNFLAPAENVKEALASVGLTADDVRAAIRDRGLTQVLGELVEKFKGNEEALGNVIPNVRALAGVLGTAGSQGEAFKAVLESIQKSSDGAGVTTKKFGEVSNTTAFSMSQLLARVETVAIAFGDALAPSLNSVLSASIPVLNGVASLVAGFAALPMPVKAAAIALGAVLAVAGPMLIMFGQLAVGAGALAKFIAVVASALGVKTAALVASTAAQGANAAATVTSSAAASTLATVTRTATAQQLSYNMVAATGTQTMRGLTAAVQVTTVATNTATAATTGFATALKGLAIFTTIVGSAIALSEALFRLGRSAQESESWLGKIGGRALATITPWGMLRTVIDDVRNALSSAKEPTDAQASSLDDAALSAQRLRDQIGGAALARDMELLTAITQNLAAKGELTPGVMKRIGDAAAGLAANGQKLSPELQAIVTHFERVTQQGPALAGTLETVNTTIARAKDEYAKLTSEQKRNIEELVRLEYQNEQIALKVGVSAETVAQYTKQLDENARTAKEAREKLTELKAAVKELEGKPTPFLPDWLDQVGRKVDVAKDEFIALLKAVQDVERGQPAGAPSWIGDVGRKVEDAKVVTFGWRDELSKLSQELANLAQVAGPLDAIAQTIARMSVASKGGGGLAEAFGKFSAMAKGYDKDGNIVARSSENMTAAVIQTASSVAALASTFLSATQSTSRFSNALNGAVVGMQAGASIGGVYGGVIGGIAGAVLGLMRDTGRMGEATYRSQLALQAQAQAAQRAEQEAADLTATIRKLANAADELSFDELQKIVDVVSDRDMDRIKEIAKALDDGVGGALSKMGQLAADNGAIFNRQMLDFIAHAKEAGVASAELSALMQRQQQASGEAFGELLRYADLSDASLRSIITAFDQIVTSGIDLGAFFESNGSAIEEFRQRLVAAGLSGSAAFQVIEQMAARAGNEISQNAVRAARAAMDVAVSLHNQSLLTTDGFRTFTQQVTHAYNVLREQGETGVDAVRRLQPQIQRAWELQREFGYAVDEGTQYLIDQGVAAGLVGDKHKSAAQQQLDAMNQVVAKLDELIKAILEVVGALDDVAGKTRTTADEFAEWQRRAEGNIQVIRDNLRDVRGALDETASAAGGLRGAFYDAERAAEDFAATTSRRMDEARNAINSVIQMRSPTGIEGIVHYTNLATQAMTRFAQVASGGLAGVAQLAARVDMSLARVAKSQIGRAFGDTRGRLRGLDAQGFGDALGGMAGLGSGLRGKVGDMFHRELPGMRLGGMDKELFDMQWRMYDEIQGLGPNPESYRRSWETARETIGKQLQYQLEDLADARKQEVAGLGMLPDAYDTWYTRAAAKASKSYDKQVRSLDQTLARELKSLEAALADVEAARASSDETALARAQETLDSLVGRYADSYEEARRVITDEHAEMLLEAQERHAEEIENLGPLPDEYRAIYEETLAQVNEYYDRMEARAKEAADATLAAVGPVPEEYGKLYNIALELVKQKYALMVAAAAESAEQTVNAWQVVLDMLERIAGIDPSRIPGGGGPNDPVRQMMTEAEAYARLVQVLGREPSRDELERLASAIGHTIGSGGMIDPTAVRVHVPGFRHGTDGYVDFGEGTLAMLHGEEKVTPRGGDGNGSVAELRKLNARLEQLSARLDSQRVFTEQNLGRMVSAAVAKVRT